jgi:hypothetical protein
MEYELDSCRHRPFDSLRDLEQGDKTSDTPQETAYYTRTGRTDAMGRAASSQPRVLLPMNKTGVQSTLLSTLLGIFNTEGFTAEDQSTMLPEP